MLFSSEKALMQVNTVTADSATKGAQQVGILIGIGDRDKVGTNPDYFSGTGDTGAYAVIKLEL